MTDYQFHCPQCHGLFAVDDSLIGAQVLCPLCSAEVLVPDVIAEAPPPPPEASPGTDTVSLDCPVCHGQFLLPRELLGRHVECPHCQSILDVGGDSAADEIGASDSDGGWSGGPPPPPPSRVELDSGVSDEERSAAATLLPPVVPPPVPEEPPVEDLVVPKRPGSRVDTPAPALPPVRRLTPQERARRRQVRNWIIGGGCLVLLLVVYWLLV